MRRVLMISRATEFSPNSVEKDLAILEAVGAHFHKSGCDVRFVAEEAFSVSDHADVYMSMGRLASTLAVLKRKERGGATVINSAYGVERCARRFVDSVMRSHAIPAAATVDNESLKLTESLNRSDISGYWLKRADVSAQTPDDVCFAPDCTDALCVLERFHRRGIEDVLITEHVVGDVVKFYGVAGTGFFRVYYPADDGDTKFGDERHNGVASHYAFSTDALNRHAEQLAVLLGVKVYGGDCIVRQDGSYAIIDFNDWPSFSRCREDAVEAICDIVKL